MYVRGVILIVIFGLSVSNAFSGFFTSWPHAPHVLICCPLSGFLSMFLVSTDEPCCAPVISR